jgi:hypothetical protein
MLALRPPQGLFFDKTCERTYHGGRKVNIATLIILVVVATSIWVFFDAPQHGLSRMAALACLLLWIVGFPLYLADRSRRRRELAVGGYRRLPAVEPQLARAAPPAASRQVTPPPRRPATTRTRSKPRACAGGTAALGLTGRCKGALA